MPSGVTLVKAVAGALAVGLVTYGLLQIYVPAAPIFVGLVLLRAAHRMDDARRAR